MPRTNELKHERMHLRLDSRTKRKLERAAAYAERSVTDFVLTNAVAAADRILEARETITLSEPDWQVFYEALTKPPGPNEQLKKAVRRYRARTGK